jgi:hypothetical protein
MKFTRLMIILAIVLTILLIPLIAMQFTEEVNWGGFDFGIASILLFLAGVGCDFAIRKATKLSGKVIWIGIILGIAALIWIELAVGLFGTPFAGN